MKIKVFKVHLCQYVRGSETGRILYGDNCKTIDTKVPSKRQNFIYIYMCVYEYLFV